MASEELSLGGLLTSYMEWEGLSKEDFVALANWGFTEREQLLPPILAKLPKESGIVSFDELDAVLWDLVGTVDFLEDPWTIAARYCELLQKRKFRFDLPFAQAPAFPVQREIGGRNQLVITTSAVGPWSMAVLSGTVEAGHAIPARRAAIGLAEQVAGLLMALDLLRFEHRIEEDLARQSASTPIGLRISPAPTDSEEEDQGETYALPWKEQYCSWASKMSEPRDLTDFERRASARAGSAPGLDRRLDLLGKLFSVGGMDAKKIRRAARFLRKTVTAEEPGDSYLFMATALESRSA